MELTQLLILSLHSYFLYLIWKELRPTKPIPPDEYGLEFEDALVSELSEDSYETEDDEDSLDRYVADHISKRRAENQLMMEELKNKISSYGTYTDAPDGLFNIPHEDADLERAIAKNKEEEYAD